MRQTIIPVVRSRKPLSVEIGYFGDGEANQSAIVRNTHQVPYKITNFDSYLKILYFLQHRYQSITERQ